MKRKIKNKSVHLIHTSDGMFSSFDERDADISDKEIAEHKYLEVVGKAKEEKSEKPKTNLLNENTVDDYMDRSGKEVIASINEDLENLTDEDINLMESYEKNKKNRPKVLEKLKRGA